MDAIKIIQEIIDAAAKVEKEKAKLFAQCFDGVDDKMAEAIRTRGMPTLLCYPPTMKDHIYHFENWVTVKENAFLNKDQIILLWKP